MKKRPSGSILLLLAFLALYAAQLVPRILEDSIVGDETWEVSAGYYFWSYPGVLRTADHPPLAGALQALPLYLLHLNSAPPAPDPENRGFLLFYGLNPGRIQTMAVAARLVTLLFGLGLGVLLYRATRGAPPALGAAVLALWAFEPTLLAMSGYAKTDVPATFFFFLAVLLFQRALENPTRWNGFLTGLAASMAVTTKISGLALGPLFLILEFWGRPWKKGSGKALANRWAFMALGALAWVPILYLPPCLHSPTFLNPYGLLWDKVTANTSGFSHNFPSYFFGQCGTEKRWYYFPVVMLLKCTLPFLILVGFGIFLAVKKKMKLGPWEWVSPLFFLALMLPAPNLGLRYLLPAFPFLLLIGGKAALWLWGKGLAGKDKARPAIALLLLTWQALSVLAAYPGHLSYFNELVPSERKIHCLADWNLDAGQDLRRLVELARKRGWEHIKLAYAGGTDPYFYGLPWRPWTGKDLNGPQPGWVYLVNAAFLQTAPCFFPETLPIARSWISSRKADGRLGDTWYYFLGPELPAEEDLSRPLPSVPVFKYVWNLKTGRPERVDFAPGP